VVLAGEWDKLVEAHRELWRRGFAASDVRRFTSWVVHDGQLCLADADTLTVRKSTALAYLDTNKTREEEHMITRVVADTPAKELLPDYFSFLGSQLSAGELRRNWPQAG
jgi:hypothetical protein